MPPEYLLITEHQPLADFQPAIKGDEKQELERQARIVDWPNLTDHYNGWNNIRYYYNDGSLFTKYREIYDGEDHDLRQKKEDNK